MIALTTEVNSVVPSSTHASSETQSLNLARFPRTDFGNAELFAQLFGDRVRFNHLQGSWLIWDPSLRRWSVDRSYRVRTFAVAAARRRLRAAQQLAIPDDGEENSRPKKEMAWALKSESRPLIEAALELAKSIPPISDAGSEWDQNPYILGVANGVVELRTGCLREETQNDRVIKRSRVRFDPAAQCPRFDAFLQSIFPGHLEMSAYIQRVMGYCLTGDLTEHRVFCNFGKGSNGKSTLTEVIRFLLDDYAVNLPFSALETQRWGNSSTHELVSLNGARFATSSETNDGSRFNEARIKALSGGDPITARNLYQNSFTFPPTHKLWLAFNHKPTVTDDTPGFWRRIDMIEYGKEFSGSEKDESLLAKLKVEAPGILAFAVRGSVSWAKERLNRPAFVAAATNEYRQETDVLGDFVAECCTLDEAATISSSSLWTRYATWAKESGETCLSKRTFLERLAKQFNLASDRIGHAGLRGWKGIRLQLGG